MDAAQDEHEREIRSKLSVAAREIDQMGDTIRSAVRDAHALPPTKEFLEKLASILLDCEMIVWDHANGIMRATDTTLKSVAETLRSVHLGINDLILCATAQQTRKIKK